MAEQDYEFKPNDIVKSCKYLEKGLCFLAINEKIPDNKLFNKLRIFARKILADMGIY